MQINCRTDVGDSGYGIPFNVDEHKLKLKQHNIRFILAVETGGMFDRLVENGFDEEHGALLIHTKGQPARSTRRIIKRMSDTWSVPVLVFTDGDPYSFRIFASIAFGAIKTAHISHYLATPNAQYLGITTDDIINYDLPSDDLTPEDIKQLKAELSDPRFQDEYWDGQINDMITLGKKAEQQALAKYGLDFVTEEYLPSKLQEFGF
tara:strand:- start:474 stop:1091 length:618 start_codon:yes stop_codon:yes gene_type:complete